MTNNAPTVSIYARRNELHDRLRKVLQERVTDVMHALSWLEATDLNLDLDDALLAMANAENVLRDFAHLSPVDPWQEYCEAFAHDANEWHGDDAACDGPFDGERVEMARAR